MVRVENDGTSKLTVDACDITSMIQPLSLYIYFRYYLSTTAVCWSKTLKIFRVLTPLSTFVFCDCFVEHERVAG